LLIVNSDSINLDEIKYSYPFTKLGWKYNIDFNVLLYSKSDWEKEVYDYLILLPGSPCRQM